MLSKQIILLMILGSIPCMYFYKKQQSIKKRLPIHACIYDGPHEQLQNNNFTINFVRNSSDSCINPHFPSIHITGDTEYNAWLHIVYTDARDSYGKSPWIFIDAGETYPFYSLERDFYDAPLWKAPFYFIKPLSYWLGHAWAVYFDPETKTIRQIMGIEWGFSWPWYALYPTAIIPRHLTEYEWNNDKEQVQSILQKDGWFMI